MSNTASNYGSGFPSGPFLDSNGNITNIWLRFLNTLYNRTGSGVGTDSKFILNSINSSKLSIDDLKELLNNLSEIVEENKTEEDIKNAVLSSQINLLLSIIKSMESDQIASIMMQSAQTVNKNQISSLSLLNIMRPL